MSELTCPEFAELDDELKGDFYQGVQEAIEDMDASLDQLSEENPNPELLHRFFRAVHSVKGNCNMVFLQPFVDVLHHLENIVARIRDAELEYCDPLGKFVQAVIHEIEPLIGEMVTSGVCDDKRLEQLQALIDAVGGADQPSVRDISNQALAGILRGDYQLQSTISSECHTTKVTQDERLQFFYDLAKSAHFDEPWRKTRMARTLQLCQRLNSAWQTAGGESLEPLQLDAAVLVHEFSMVLVPREIREKAGSLSNEEWELVKNHVRIGAGLLRQIPGFETASEIVLRHHERFDGKGYPEGLAGEGGCPGAWFLALADTFMAVTSDRPDRPYKKSLLSAVRLINCERDRQFPGRYVDVFNDVIKQEYLRNPQW